MRVALILGGTLLLGAVGVFACSDDDKSTTPTGSTSGDNGTSGDDGTSGDNGTSGDPSTSSSGNSGASSSGNSGTSSSGGSSSGGSSSGGSSSGGNPFFDSGALIDGGDAGTRCHTLSVEESEDNGAAGTATTFTAPGSVCGSISTGGVSGDVDFVKFTLPQSATKFFINEESSSAGDIQISATVEGQTFDVIHPDGGVYPFQAGKDYVLEISSASGAFDYLITVTTQ